MSANKILMLLHNGFTRRKGFLELIWYLWFPLDYFLIPSLLFWVINILKWRIPQNQLLFLISISYIRKMKYFSMFLFMVLMFNQRGLLNKSVYSLFETSKMLSNLCSSHTKKCHNVKNGIQYEVIILYLTSRNFNLGNVHTYI